WKRTKIAPRPKPTARTRASNRAIPAIRPEVLNMAAASLTCESLSLQLELHELFHFSNSDAPSYFQVGPQSLGSTAAVRIERPNHPHRTHTSTLHRAIRIGSEVWFQRPVVGDNLTANHHRVLGRLIFDSEPQCHARTACEYGGRFHLKPHAVDRFC